MKRTLIFALFSFALAGVALAWPPAGSASSDLTAAGGLPGSALAIEETGVQFSLLFLVTTLIAGILTVVSPCVLPLLPIVIGGSTFSKSLAKSLRIIGALAVSVIVFSLLLKASTTLIGVPDHYWRWLSGGILIIFGILTFFPGLWDGLVEKAGLKKSSHKLLSRSTAKGGIVGDLFIGAALGPVFTSCSPAYLYVVGVVIPQQSWFFGFIYLLSFVIGLSLVLFLVALFGRKFISKVSALNNPKGWFKRILAVIFVTVGVLVFAGWDKDIEAYLVERGLYDWLVEFEDRLPDPPASLFRL